MFDFESFMTAKNLICLMIILATMVVAVLPHRILDTSSCKRTWSVVLILLATLGFLIDQTLFGCFFSFIFLSALLTDFCLKKLKHFKIERSHYEQYKQHK